MLLFTNSCYYLQTNAIIYKRMLLFIKRYKCKMIYYIFSVWFFMSTDILISILKLIWWQSNASSFSFYFILSYYNNRVLISTKEARNFSKDLLLVHYCHAKLVLLFQFRFPLDTSKFNSVNLNKYKLNYILTVVLFHQDLLVSLEFPILQLLILH